ARPGRRPARASANLSPVPAALLTGRRSHQVLSIGDHEAVFFGAGLAFRLSTSAFNFIFQLPVARRVVFARSRITVSPHTFPASDDSIGLFPVNSSASFALA